MSFSSIHWNIDPVLLDLGVVQLRYYSLLFATGLLLGAWLMQEFFKKERVNAELIYSLILYIGIGTLLGARLGHCLFYDFQYFIKHPLEIFLPFAKDISGSWHFTGFTGLASHGGIIGVAIAAYLFARKKKLSYLWLLDRLAIVGALAGCFIRIGNFFNSEIIGIPTNLPWGVVFEQVDNVPRHPAQLYEAIAYLLIFGVLWIIYKYKRTQLNNGFILGLFFTLLFTTRLLVEYVKVHQSAFEEGMMLNMGQILSIPFIIFGIVLMIVKWRKPHITSTTTQK